MVTERGDGRSKDPAPGWGPEDESAVRAKFGQRLVKLRKARGWSRNKLAARLGISRQRLTNWEQGSSSPTLEMLLALKRVLGIPLDELVSGEKEQTPGLSRDERIRALQHATELLKVLR